MTLIAENFFTLGKPFSKSSNILAMPGKELPDKSIVSIFDPSPSKVVWGNGQLLPFRLSIFKDFGKASGSMYSMQISISLISKNCKEEIG